MANWVPVLSVLSWSSPYCTKRCYEDFKKKCVELLYTHISLVEPDLTFDTLYPLHRGKERVRNIAKVS